MIGGIFTSRNPKSEIRNPKQFPNFKREMAQSHETGRPDPGFVLSFIRVAHLDLFRISDFGFRISNLASFRARAVHTWGGTNALTSPPNPAISFTILELRKV